MKKEITDEGTTFTVEEPTVAGIEIAEKITTIMIEYSVAPDYVLGVLGEGVIRFLAAWAEMRGYRKQELVNIFGDGLANAELEFYD